MQRGDVGAYEDDPATVSGPGRESLSAASYPRVLQCAFTARAPAATMRIPSFPANG